MERTSNRRVKYRDAHIKHQQKAKKSHQQPIRPLPDKRQIRDSHGFYHSFERVIHVKRAGYLPP